MKIYIVTIVCDNEITNSTVFIDDRELALKEFLIQANEWIVREDPFIDIDDVLEYQDSEDYYDNDNTGKVQLLEYNI